jgi:cell wall-associated NlpC family hydrolase
MMQRAFILVFCVVLAALGTAQAQAQEKNSLRQIANPDALGAFLDKLNDTSKATIGVATNVTSTVLTVAQDVVVNALGLIGVAYKYGGNTVEQGLDCSGFVKLVFQQSMGLVLPRRSDEMSRIGSDVAREDLQPGDLVFYNTLRRANSHVGIYVGEGQFVHSPSAGGKVRVEKMSNTYWAKRFDGAKRVTQTTP